MTENTPNYQGFKDAIKEAARTFSSLEVTGPIRIISHLDSDGISAASIIIRALQNEGHTYEISIVQQVSDELLDDLKKETHNIIFFTDLGSGKAKEISQTLSGRKIFILDHHEMTDNGPFPGIVHINPHLFGIEGGREISGSGVVFLFAKSLNEKNDSMAHIAVIGAIGDVQENKGFQSLNNEILEMAKQNGAIEAKMGLRSFGKTRQVHKMLEYSSDPFIPGVTGSESGAVQLLTEAGIPISNGSGFRRYIDLTEIEQKRLSSAIILRRMGEAAPDDIFGFNYILAKEQYPNLRDAKEFSTLLNASGRLDNASLGIGVCLGDELMKKKAISNLADYKKAIVSSLNWFNASKANPQDVEMRSGYMIINARENVRSTIAGTIASIISKSNDYEKGTLILSTAYSEDGIKASLRIVGDFDVDLREIMKEIIASVGGETGGHKNAAGAVIARDKEKVFLDSAREVLAKSSSNLRELSVGKSHA